MAESFEVPDFDTVRDQMTAFASNRAPEFRTSPVDWLGEQIGSQAQVQQALGEKVGRAANDAVPTESTSTVGLDTWADGLGLYSGKPGVYGRRVPTRAMGATIQITGDRGTPYLANQAGTGPGGVPVKLRSAVTISGTPPGTGNATGIIDADVDGEAGNLLAGAVITWVSPPPGSDPSGVLLTGMSTKARGAEQDPELLKREQDKLRNPPNGGNGAQFAAWIDQAVDGTGQALAPIPVNVYRYPNYFDMGSPLLVVALPGAGLARKPDSALLAAYALYLDGTVAVPGQRPVSVTENIAGPYMPDARALVIKARTVPSEDTYRFDWVRGDTAYVINSFTATIPAGAPAGTNFVLELNRFAPVDLKTAITKAQLPKIFCHFVDGAGTLLGPVVPEQAPCLGYRDNVGTTSLYLQVSSAANWASWASVNNEVFAGGPIVIPVAQAIDDRVNSLGPSKASGLDDQAQQWEDTLAVTGVSTAAETTLDTDGVTRLVTRCIAGGVLIGIGGAAVPIAQDVQASDTTVNGPELLRSGRILVTD